MIPVSTFLARMPLAAVAFNAGPYLAGARVFHAAAEGQALWVADLARFGGAAPLGNNLFLSADGKNFHQLRVVERQESCVLTDTPGFLPALAVYQDQGMALILSGRDVSEESLLVSLNRVSRKILDQASFFSVESPVSGVVSKRRGDGPRVRAAERDREPDRQILFAQSRLAALDRGRERRSDYRLDRGLEESSRCAAVTHFGPIEDKICGRIGTMSVYRANPLRLLTIGPGQGRMEAELSDLFAPYLSIDSLTLNDAVAPENWQAFDNLFLGNLDTHRLPAGYDLVISIYGTSYAVDQRRALGQIIDALNPGGEAFFLVTGQMIPGHAPEVLGGDEIVHLRDRYGLIYESEPNPRIALASGLLIECVSLKKTRSCPPSNAVLAPRWDVKEVTRQAWEAFLLIAKSRNLELDPSATELDLARFRERLAAQRRRWSRGSHRTAIETVLFLWPWIEDQGILLRANPRP